MDQIQLATLKQLGVPEVIRRYLPRIGKPPEEGGITKETYAKLLHLVAPNLPQNPGGTDYAGTRLDTSDRPQDEARGETEELTQPHPAPITPRVTSAGSHTDPARGQSQKERIHALLQDHEWHTTVEIMNKIYRVGEDRGNCRIPSRICELRQEGYNIETRRITQTLTAYRLV